MAGLKKFFLRISPLSDGLSEAVRGLSNGAHRHDVLEAGVRIIEQNPAVVSVGFGGAPNILGEMEQDGAFMDGNARACGAVMGLKHHFPSAVAGGAWNTPTTPTATR